MTRSTLVDISAELVHETDAAWLLDCGHDDPVWIPKSVGEFDDADGTLTLPENWALIKGLI